MVMHQHSRRLILIHGVELALTDKFQISTAERAKDAEFLNFFLCVLCG